MTCSYCKTHRSSGTNCPNCGAAQCEESSIVAPARAGAGDFIPGLFVVPQNPIMELTSHGMTAAEVQRACSLSLSDILKRRLPAGERPHALDSKDSGRVAKT